MGRALRIALGLALHLWRRSEAPPRRSRVVPAGAADPGAETAVVLLLLASALCAGGFIAVYALDRIPAQTQFLGLSLGLSFAFLAAALVVTGKRLVVTEELEEDYPGPHEEDQEAIDRVVAESGSRLTRKKLLLAAGGAAAGTLGAALVAPAVSLGPVLDMDRFYRTPWRRGRRLVDERGQPFPAAAVEEGVFYTAYPEGADPEELGAPLVVVRLPTSELRLPHDRAGWAPRGILAYSKICTHAGCAIALYRAPLFQPSDPRPALVCPCHYSTFDPATGGTVLFGPAGRPLPQLPLLVDGRGYVRAAGTFSGAIGPAWWGVRMRGRSS